MKKIRTTIYISEDTHKKLIDLVHKVKSQGVKTNQSDIIERSIELYDKNEKDKDKIRSAFTQEDIDSMADAIKSDFLLKTGQTW